MKAKAAAITTAIFIGIPVVICLFVVAVYYIAEAFGPLTIVIVPSIGAVAFIWYGMYRAVLRELKNPS